jgi:hypothetical protein
VTFREPVIGEMGMLPPVPVGYGMVVKEPLPENVIGPPVPLGRGIIVTICVTVDVEVEVEFEKVGIAPVLAAPEDVGAVPVTGLMGKDPVEHGMLELADPVKLPLGMPEDGEDGWTVMVRFTKLVEAGSSTEELFVAPTGEPRLEFDEEYGTF